MLLLLLLASLTCGVTDGQRLQPKPSYLISAPSRVRPGQTMQVAVNVLSVHMGALTVRTSVRRYQEEVASAMETFRHPTAILMQLQIPEATSEGTYWFKVEGSVGGSMPGSLFMNQTEVEFFPKRASVFIQPSKYIFRKKDTMVFRVLAVHPDMRPISTGTVTIYVIDGKGNIMRRWYQQQLNNGLVEIEYRMSHPVHYKYMTIRVEGFGQVYEEKVWTYNYYPERIDINITMPSLIKEDHYGLIGLVQANLTKGFPVRGNATIQLEVQPPDSGEAKLIERHLPVFDGAADFLFRMEEIQRHTHKLAGTRLKVTASLEDWHGLDSRTESAYADIYSSEIRYRFIGGVVRTFKPEVEFNVQVAVYGEDGTRFDRTRNQQVRFYRVHTTTEGSTYNTPETRVLIGQDSIARMSFIPSENDAVIRVHASYDGASYTEMVATRHYTRSNHYIQISSSTREPRANEYMVFTVKTTTFIPEVFYQVMSKGNIFLFNTLFMTATQKTFSIALSRDMVPGARILVYAVLGNGEVLTDSLSFHVRGVRNYGINVKVNKGKDFSGDTVEIIGTTDPSTLTMIAGQQYDLYRRGLHHFLTEQKVEDELATYDNGNSSFKQIWYDHEFRAENQYFSAPSMAMDANTTFGFSGLLVYTDADLTRHPAVYECNETRGYYPCYSSGCFLERDRCDGVRQCSSGADELGCPVPSEEVVLRDQIQNMLIMERHMDSATWLWGSHFTRPDGSIQFTADVPHWPATWLVQGVSLSTEHGLAFTEIPARVDTTRSFYLEVEVPKQAFRGEQLGVQVTVCNYWHQPLEALLTLKGSKDHRFINVESFGVVSSYAPRVSSGDHQTMVYLSAGESKIIHFPVLPVKVGRVKIEIQGVSFINKRSVTQTVQVDMEGVTNYYHTPYYVDLVNKGSQVIPDLDIPIPEQFKMPEEFRHLYVPGSQKASLSIVGDVVGPGYGMASDLHTENLMRLKTGPCETYIFNFAFNLYWLRFLEASHQLTDQWEQWATNALIKYYPNIMAYRMTDGSLSMWRKRAPSCVWCTMMALQMLNEASDPKREYDIYIHTPALDDMALWLAGTQDPDTGAFAEISTIYDLKLMTNGTWGEGRQKMTNVSLTAFGVIALQKTGKLSGVSKGAADSARERAADYIAAQLPHLSDPFEICIVCYALHVAGHPQRGLAFRKMEDVKWPDKPYWSRREIPEIPEQIVTNIPYLKPKPWAMEAGTAVQATSYALMVYLLTNRLTAAEPIMIWLQTQRNTDGAFTSSQDSIVALQALAEFSKSDTNRALYRMHLNVDVTSSPSWNRKVVLERGKFLNYNTLEAPIAYGSFRSTVTGTGRALMQLSTEVNVEFPDQLRQPPERSFDLTIENLRFSGRNSSRFDIMVCARWLRTDIAPTAGFSLVQFDIPTGFHVHKKELRLLQRRNPLILRARYTGGQVVLYFDYVPATKTCFDFYSFRWLPVANVTIQNQIRFYSFYEPMFQNYTIYNSWDLFHNHICQVCGSFQCPYCPYYNAAHAYHQSTVVSAICMLLSALLILLPVI